MTYECEGFAIFLRLTPIDKSVRGFKKYMPQFNRMETVWDDVNILNLTRDYGRVDISIGGNNISISYWFKTRDDQVKKLTDNKIFNFLDNEFLPTIKQFLNEINENFKVEYLVKIVGNRTGVEIIHYDNLDKPIESYEYDPVTIRRVSFTYDPEEN